MKKFFSNPYVIFVIKIVIAITLLTLLLHYIDVEKIAESISTADTKFIVLGFALGILNISIQWYRWKYLLQLVASDISNGEILRSIFIGISAGFFTPGQIGEFAGRIAGHSNISKSYVAGMSLVDKIYILTTTFFWGIPALAIFVRIFYPEYWILPFELIALGVFIALSLLSIFPQLSKKLLMKLPQKIRQHKFYKMIDVIETRFHTKQAVVMFLLTILFYFVVFMQYYIFVLSFESVSFTDSLIAVSSIFFVKNILLPLSIGDLGIRESAAVFFYSKFGILPATAFNASMLVFLTNLLIPSIIGSILIMRLKITLKK